MTLSPEHYEKLGAFFLGREYDVESKTMTEEVVMYDSKNLVTHGVVLGMTGSGKTGLCLALLEEAAMDGIPVIAIDPKGDIGNFLLQFPELNAESFRPWVNEDDARRKGRTPEEHAASQAETWQKGLADWGQSGERIRQLLDKTDTAIYTPGSNAGLPVSILSSLDAPDEEMMEDSELLAERIESSVSSLLGFMGVNADPVQSKEHILLSNIFAHFWAKRQNLTLEVLVRAIQQPPLRQIGVVDIESFLPEARRADLAMKLNNLLASPGFGVWMQGEPLDIQRMFYTAEGKPRVSIFCIAHLGDAERMFFVSLLLNQLLGWMRRQSGTTSLRALFYMDEIFGYLPPTANPPSKKPMMILLKQARAFGLGLLLGTQNPVDLDYKALSNIGTWFLGRLQTERDMQRVLDGLQGAATSSGAVFDRASLQRLLAGLGNRIFLMNNVHEDHPVVFQVRWVMSYLSGPLSRAQIKTLMDPRRPAPAPSVDQATGVDGFAPPGAAAAAMPTARNTIKPRLPEGVKEHFLRPSGGADVDHLTYVPALLRSAEVLFEDAKKGIACRRVVTLVNEIDVPGQRVLWDKFVEIPRSLEVEKFEATPETGAAYADLPGAALKSATFTSIEKDFIDQLHAKESLELLFSPLLNVYSEADESESEFKARVAQRARELRDEAVAALRAKAEKTLKALYDKERKAAQKVETEKAQASSAKLDTAVRLGTRLLGAFLGGRKTSIRSVAGTTAVTGVSRALEQSRQADAAQRDFERVKQEREDAEKKLEEEIRTLQDQYTPDQLRLEKSRFTPLKKNIRAIATGILWLPHEEVRGALRPSWERFE